MTRPAASPPAGTSLPEHARLRALAVDSIAEELAILDARGLILDVNDAWRHFARDNGGDPRTTAVGVNYLAVCRKAARAGDTVAAAAASGLEAVLRHEQPRFTLEYQCDRFDSHRWFQLRAEAGGCWPDLVVSHTEITRAKLAELERHDLVRRLEERRALEAVGLLAGGLAHDLNNVVGVILGNAGLAIRQLAAGSPALERLAAVERAADYASELIRGWLANLKRDRRRSELVDLDQLAADTLRLIGVSIPRAIEVRHTRTPDLPAVIADATAVRQVVMNLVLNARDAIGERAGLVTVTTRVVSGGDLEGQLSGRSAPRLASSYVAIEVGDDGCGMDPVLRERVFDPLFTTKPIGNGLGLAVVLDVVRAHAGLVDVDSAPGAGSRVRVLFPVPSGLTDPPSGAA